MIIAMTQDEIRIVQLQVFEIFKAFDAYCKEHNLRYYMLGGSMLGAVRHKGFIPWDDDMDVGMPREDYEMLLKERADCLSTDEYTLLCGKWDERFTFDFAKIMKKIPVGEKQLDVFLDIFPLDGCPAEDPQKIKKYYQKFDFIRMMKNTHVMELKNKNFPKKIVVVIGRLIPVKTYRKMMDRFLKKNGFYESISGGNFSGHWEDREIMDRNIYGEPQLIEFEGGLYYGVEHPHEYLTQLYGDYMTMPPLEEQLSHFD